MDETLPKMLHSRGTKILLGEIIHQTCDVVHKYGLFMYNAERHHHPSAILMSSDQISLNVKSVSLRWIEREQESSWLRAILAY